MKQKINGRGLNNLQAEWRRVMKTVVMDERKSLQSFFFFPLTSFLTTALTSFSFFVCTYGGRAVMMLTWQNCESRVHSSCHPSIVLSLLFDVRVVVSFHNSWSCCSRLGEELQAWPLASLPTLFSESQVSEEISKYSESSEDIFCIFRISEDIFCIFRILRGHFLHISESKISERH